MTGDTQQGYVTIEIPRTIEPELVEPREFVPTKLEQTFLRELAARAIPFLIGDFWRYDVGGQEPLILCDLLLEPRQLHAVRALARELGAPAPLRDGKLRFRGPLARFHHAREEDFGTLPLTIELHAARTLKLAPALKVPFLTRARYASLHLPMARQSFPKVRLPKPATALVGATYVFARLLRGSKHTEALLLDAKGRHVVLDRYRSIGRTPCFGDSVQVRTRRSL